MLAWPSDTCHRGEPSVSKLAPQPIDAAVPIGVSWRSVCKALALHAASLGSALAAVAQALLGGPVEPSDFLWLRTMVQGFPEDVVAFARRRLPGGTGYGCLNGALPLGQACIAR